MVGQWHFGKAIDPGRNPECGELSHVMLVFLPPDFCGIDNRLAHAHTHSVTKGANSMGFEEAEGQITYRSCFTKDQLLDLDRVLKARIVCKGLQMVDGAMVVLEYMDKR